MPEVPAAVQAEWGETLDREMHAYAQALEAEFRGMKEARDASGHEHDNLGRFGSGGGNPHAKADAKAKSILAKAKGVSSAAVHKAADFVVKKYQDLESQFGRQGAVLILSASVALVPVPVPGASLAPVALAKAYQALKAKFGGVREAAEGELDAESVDKAARELLAALYAEAGEDMPELDDGGVNVHEGVILRTVPHQSPGANLSARLDRMESVLNQLTGMFASHALVEAARANQPSVSPVQVNYPAPELKVEPPPINVTVNVPEQPVPTITLAVPEQKPPVVNVDLPPSVIHVDVPPATVNVTVPDPAPRRIEIERDREGKITGAEEVPAK